MKVKELLEKFPIGDYDIRDYLDFEKVYVSTNQRGSFFSPKEIEYLNKSHSKKIPMKKVEEFWEFEVDEYHAECTDTIIIYAKPNQEK